MVPVLKTTYTENHNSDRFCFDIDPFVSPCGCDVGYATCVENPCQTTSCPSYPESRCRIDFCGECKARWYVLGVEKDCYEERGLYIIISAKFKILATAFYTLPHNSGGVLWFHVGRPCVCLSSFRFWMIT